MTQKASKPLKSYVFISTGMFWFQVARISWFHLYVFLPFGGIPLKKRS